MQTSSPNKQIALVGMACRLPGADDLQGYWKIIRDGVATAGLLPESRFDRSLYFDPRQGIPNRSYCDIGCLVNQRARGRHFDSLPAAVHECPEAAYRNLCDVAAEALDDAGVELYPARRRSGGVYLGHSRSSGLAGDLAYGTCIAQSARLLGEVQGFRELDVDHQGVIDELVSQVRSEMPHRDQQGRPALGPHVASAMLAQTFAMGGPAMTFNSACASSLSALHQAVLALQQGRIDMAMVAGASVCHFETLVMFSQAQSLSSVMSRPFDDDADGLVVGEGYVVVILKTLEQALRDGDRIHGVIRGIGVSSDGKGKSLWAPRKQGQMVAIGRAYGEDLKSANLQYIEAHATSTQLGDATEVVALAEALKLPPGRRIPIGSVKANIGHTLETAGLAGLVKAVLCMRHQTIAPAVNVNRLNTSIDWDSLPFYVPLQAEHWPEPAGGSPRRAAVNAFGIGGLNVHVVLEEFPAGTDPTAVHAGVDVVQTKGHRQRVGQVQLTDRSPADAVAVIGRGTVLPGALNVDAFAQLLISGDDPKGPIPAHRTNPDIYLDPSGPRPWHCVNNLAGVVKGFQYDWRTHKIPPKQIANANPLQFMILDAVDQAFREAGLDRESTSRIGVVVGSPFGGEFATQLLMGLRLPEFQRRLVGLLDRLGCDPRECDEVSRQYAQALIQAMPALLDETGSFTSSSLASRITKSFDLMGGGVAVDAGNCSSAAALMCCVDQLATAACDMMVCVGGQEDLSATFLERMGLAGLLTQGTPRSPLDAAAGGIVPAEGCGALLLMRLADAKQQKRKIWGIIQGVGVATADSQSEASQRAVDDALRRTARQDWPLAAGDVARIETTSVACQRRTAEELDGIYHAYAQRTRQRPISLDCLMTQTGHLGAASAVAALIKSTLELEHLKTTATFGLTRPLPLIESNPLFDVAPQPQPLEAADRSGRLVTAVHNCERQTAYHILLQRDAKVHAPSKPKAPVTAPVTAKASYDSSLVDGIQVVDATRRRKEAMRDKAMRQSRSATELPSQVAQSPSQVPAAASDARESLTLPTNTPAPTQTPAPTRSNHLHAAPTDSVSTGLSDDQLKEFLNRFVVEQTGYPPEFVEMDADLEADLGIDSIKKAQMFGELGEHFAITPDETLTLDDFPTLQHIFDYLAASDATSAPPVEPSRRTPAPDQPHGASLHAPDQPHGASLRAPDQPHDASLRAPDQPHAASVRAPDQPHGASLRFPDVPEPNQPLHHNTPSPHDRRAGDSITTTADRPDRNLDLIPDAKRINRTKDLLDFAGLSIPYFAEHESVTQDTTRVDGKQVVTFCSSNYLGMSGDPIVSAAAKEAIDRYGTSVSASRLIAGKPLHRELEDELARFLGVEATLVFSSGYAANESIIGHLFGPGDLVIHDSLAHNCIIQGAELSGAQRLSFPHNDSVALDRQLQKIRHKYGRTLIAIEGAYSMDGDHPDLPAFLDIKRRHDAFLLVDDAHAIGTMGTTGRGSPEFFGLDSGEIDLWVGTLSKAFGSGGGFVAGSRELIEYLKYSTPGFIYTVALSPGSAGAALASLRLLQQQPQRVAKLQNNARLLLELARQRGLDTGPARDTPVVPIMVGNSHTALLLSRRLLDRGIDIQPIVYPAVENDAARLRFMITARHSEEQIRTTIDALAEDLHAVQAESVPIAQWQSVLSGKSPMPSDANPAGIADAGMIRPISNESQPIEASVPSPSESNGPQDWTTTDLQEYLVNFIVEQTGYPPEFVEMDADMEADLGIDSIKKAQLFGELGQHFQITPDESLTLDDFPTLQDVFDYIADAIGIGV
ncbi:8-amino-7-oxononanoate synthase [Stieleria maiorica]|uniref:8-amino-7-oxononanoate synthase n=1 Tax=Stieleria maiorica TaxID=2795974 RepID=A0A5B9MGH7_9BACT|nr:aminotransferase class I/II-fold pyridoxal phosphate-dependent enzyme [Stieleria maiorica]QEG00269.1 8-amino-7-oxononanoate synthase [Stieleria maiorica]